MLSNNIYAPLRMRYILCILTLENSLRAPVCKYRLEVCKMKKLKIPKLCQNIGLGKLFLEK